MGPPGDQTYQQAANEAGHDLGVETAGFWCHNIFQKFWFNEGYRRASDPPARPVEECIRA